MLIPEERGAFPPRNKESSREFAAVSSLKCENARVQDFVRYSCRLRCRRWRRLRRSDRLFWDNKPRDYVEQYASATGQGEYDQDEPYDCRVNVNVLPYAATDPSEHPIRRGSVEPLPFSRSHLFQPFDAGILRI